MNVNRYGRAKILTQQEIQLVFAQGFDSERDKTLFGVCLFTAARIREACTNHFSNWYYNQRFYSWHLER